MATFIWQNSLVTTVTSSKKPKIFIIWAFTKFAKFVYLLASIIVTASVMPHLHASLRARNHRMHYFQCYLEPPYCRWRKIKNFKK